jgi:hypothetical protein
MTDDDDVERARLRIWRPREAAGQNDDHVQHRDRCERGLAALFRRAEKQLDKRQSAVLG